jgi:hypothetical protein
MPEEDDGIQNVSGPTNLLTILILLAVLIGIIVVLLNIGGISDTIGSFLNRNNQNNPDNNPYNNPNYNNTSYQNDQGNMNQSRNNPLDILGPQLQAAVDSGDWGTADSIMSSIDSMSSQLPPAVQNLLPQFDQAVRNRDQATFDNLAKQAQQAINADKGSNQSSQKNVSNQTNPKITNPQVSDWCIPGAYAGNNPNIPPDSTIMGMTDHNGEQMCYITYQATQNGKNITADCYFGQSMFCCAITVQGQSPQFENCWRAA